MEPYAEVVSQYTDFAAHAEDESPCFEEWALGVAGDSEVVTWVESLPGPKRQPNIVFASARWHGVPAPGPYAGLRDALLGDDGTIRATIMSRATQTNEVGRLATLVPAFAVLARGRPLSLVEAGASAGLCLYPDRWGYSWWTREGMVRRGRQPRLSCSVFGPAPLPDVVPWVVWRSGVDLNPLDVEDADAMAWLTNLVWPEDDDRRAKLARAIEVARAEPPRLVRGDLLKEVATLVADAPRHGPVVVFHSAVVAYLSEPDRRRFQTLMSRLVASGACHWVSNEAPNVLPEVTKTLPRPPRSPGFVLGIDGRAVALTHGHGREMRWLDLNHG